VANELLLEIVRGELPAGSLLPREAELAARFGVNRSVVREGIKLLEVHRLVRPVRRRGTEVLSPFASLSPEVLRAMLSPRPGVVDVKVLSSVLEVRAALDVQMVGLAAERVTKPEIKVLVAELTRLEKLLADPARFTEASFAFAILLARATKNPVFEMLAHWNRRVVDDLDHVFSAIRQNPDRNFSGWMLLVERFRERDAEGARTLVEAFHGWATPRLLAAAELANGTPISRLGRSP
jgi:GntR family transcriptional regulator, transcriptional repressor for pyruvate dehydrogenase complex